MNINIDTLFKKNLEIAKRYCVYLIIYIIYFKNLY